MAESKRELESNFINHGNPAALSDSTIINALIAMQYYIETQKGGVCRVDSRESNH